MSWHRWHWTEHCLLLDYEPHTVHPRGAVPTPGASKPRSYDRLGVEFSFHLHSAFRESETNSEVEPHRAHRAKPGEDVPAGSRALLLLSADTKAQKSAGTWVVRLAEQHRTRQELLLTPEVNLLQWQSHFPLPKAGEDVKTQLRSSLNGQMIFFQEPRVQ